MATTPRIPIAGGGMPMFAGASAVGAAFARLYGTLWQHGTVDLRIKELVRIRNARVTDCGF